MKNKRVSASAPWFLPSGTLLSIRSDLLNTLKAIQGMTPREIARSEKVKSFKWDDDEDDGSSAFEDGSIESVGSTAIVRAIGPLTQYSGVCDWMFGGISYEAILSSLEQAIADDAISSIVLYVDSPGGATMGSADASDRIRELSAIKPIVGFTPGECCSAGYKLFCAAPKTVVTRTAMVGCIGTVWSLQVNTKALEMEGIEEYDFVSSISPDKRPDPSSKEGSSIIQATVDEYGDLFVSHVARMRGVSEDKVLNDFGNGWVLIGEKAVEAGLADQVGSLDDAIQLATSLAGAAGNSTTTPGSTPALTAQGSPWQEARMPENLTAAQVRAESPEVASAISADAIMAERNRIAAIQKYNTPQYRSFGAAIIDAAIADGTTAEQLAVKLLDAQSTKNAAVKAAMESDSASDEVDDPESPDSADARASKSGAVKLDFSYDTFNATNGRTGVLSKEAR